MNPTGQSTSVRRVTGRPARPTRLHVSRAVSARALRAADLFHDGPRPAERLTRAFGIWLAQKLAGILVLVTAGYLLFGALSSDRFRVHSVDISGNHLLSSSEIESRVNFQGTNVFWLNQAEISARLADQPIIQRVAVSSVVPSTITVAVVERTPTATWRAGSRVYLVDSTGLIFREVDPIVLEDDEFDRLPHLEQIDSDDVQLGTRLDPRIITVSQQLEGRLPEHGIRPAAFRWSRAYGIEIPTQFGWVVRFDSQAPIETQLVALETMRDELSRVKTPVALVDLRFGDRPYYR